MVERAALWPVEALDEVGRVGNVDIFLVEGDLVAVAGDGVDVL